ncbi:hypothetical protein AB0L53_52355 [Nonomuraea sp. NPDC052129]|uniref:hypothetical protein n=1 Tax=Nonomuraea sp. NPDC052129 TaxID=3154651 RepID=UPI00341441E1
MTRKTLSRRVLAAGFRGVDDDGGPVGCGRRDLDDGRTVGGYFDGLGVTGVWKSESSEIFAGTHGSAEYLTRDCLDGRLYSRSVRVNWFTSFLAAISYDADGADPDFRVDINGNSEEHATVRFTLRAA